MNVNLFRNSLLRAGILKNCIVNIKILIFLLFASSIASADTQLVYVHLSHNNSNSQYFIGAVGTVAGKNVFTSGFSTKDINKLLKKFEKSFKEGDITTFIGLFEKNVKTEDGNSRDVLEKEYRDLFMNTQSRSIKFKNAIWEEDKNGIIWGDIDFILNIRNRLNNKISQFSGTMRFYFKKRNNTLAIDGFFHAYDEKTTNKI